jgi:3-oxoacyl-[acyl-carrier-protein] synthase-3
MEKCPMNAYITSMGVFLPGEPVDNDSMEDYLGKIGGKPSRVRQRILKQNGIQTRYYAMDRQQKTLFSNSEMAALAVRDAVARGSVDLSEIDYLAAATSQGDFPLPGFASTVHAELDIPPCEIATFHGICASGVMALRSAMLQVLGGGKNKAVVCASEFASRLFKASRFEAQAKLQGHCLGFDTEFLRWMLSDGAGAAVVERTPSANGLCFEIEWIELKSYASRFDACMYVGPEKNGGPLASWLDYPSYHAAADEGAINLRQDIRLLGDVVRCAVRGLLDVVQKAGLDASNIDWLVAHYSSHVFRDESYELAAKGGLDIPYDRWFTNLYTKGNVGSASIFVLLEELLHSGKLEPGQTVLCLVPESGRFLFGYMLLRVRQGMLGASQRAADPMPKTEPPHLEAGGDPLAQSLVRRLAQVWFEFEERLHRVPIVAKLNQGRFTVEDYKTLLFNLRQQVIDGSRWIARAASSITPEYFPIRSAFIAHTSDEHRDFEMLERNYAAVGGDLTEMRSGKKNIGSEALSAYMLQVASQENPFPLIGAMFIVEGLGNRISRQWGERIQRQLGLANESVSFFLYHAESDVKHFKRLDLAIGSGILTEKMVDDIVKCAKVTGRLYALQLEEIGNF